MTPGLSQRKTHKKKEQERKKEKIIASSITDRSLFFFLYFFFQNNKNSLTNKDFFILSISTRIYSWGWNKRLVVSISSHSWLRSHPDRPSPTPRQAWQESTRGLLLCLWRGIQAIQWLVTRKSKRTSLTFAFLGASPFCSELRQRQACLYIRQVTLISRFMIDDACFSLTGMTLEDKWRDDPFLFIFFPTVETPHKRRRRDNWQVSHPFFVWRR